MNQIPFHVIKDPVHGTMQFTTQEDNWIKPFIDSAPFQRLRHIKQLGMGDFLFPGAVHTRLNHSLGCCYTASQIAHKIGLDAEETQLVMIACLLHDIGHGPFSHAFEDIFSYKIRHESWTPFFLNEFSHPAFFDRYNQLNYKHPLDEEKFQLIENMIMHKSNSKQVLADIVSSQLDADRLDYLLRDSHFCGVAYGQFDFRWMLNSMLVVSHNQSKRLGLTHKGIGVGEHYLMARRLMTKNIYHHQKKLALEFLLVQLLANLAAHLETDTAFNEIKLTRLGQFLMAVNRFNQRAKADETLPGLKHQFLKENYQNYKELYDYDIFVIVRQLTELNITHPATEIAKRLYNRQIPKIVRLDHLNSELTENLVAEFKSQHATRFEDWQFALIKTPHQAYSKEEDPILIQIENGLVKPLNDLSIMINAISDKSEHTAFLCIDRQILAFKPVQAFLTKLAIGETA